MDQDYQYRIMHRRAGFGEPWVPWNNKPYDRKTAEHWLLVMKANDRFYRWGREYALQRRSYGEWEEINE